MANKKIIEEKLNALSAFLKQYIYAQNKPPTIREICQHVNFSSTSTAYSYLRKLQEKGEILIHKNESRGISFQGQILKPSEFSEIPLLGDISAGIPILAQENYFDKFFLPHNLFNASGDLFMLNVSGSSMVEIGINDGDLLIVKSQNYANNGQVVAVLIDEELSTVKRFFKENDVVRLHPENKNMSDIFPQTVSILGIVIGLIRTEVK
jgi:repressor LexA